MLTPEEVLALRRIPTDGNAAGVWQFESAATLPAMGPIRGDMGYGGSTLALAVHAAYHTLPDTEAGQSLRLYSVLGHFLGPNRSSVPLRFRVVSLRDTRSFATRQVLVTQQSAKGGLVTCCVVLIDFLARKSKGKESTVVSYSPPAPASITHYDKLEDHDAFVARQIREGVAPEALLQFYQPFYNLLTMWHNRYCPEGVMGQNAIGMRHDLVTAQTEPSVPLHVRRSWDWMKLRRPCRIAQTPDADGVLLPPSNVAASAALLTHFLDTWTSVLLPWMLNADDSKIDIYATLDFAIRFHVDDLDATRWHVRQQAVPTASDERNLVEEQLWREGATKDEPFQLVASVSQVCVLRGQPIGKQDSRL